MPGPHLNRRSLCSAVCSWYSRWKRSSGVKEASAGVTLVTPELLMVRYLEAGAAGQPACRAGLPGIHPAPVTQVR